MHFIGELITQLFGEILQWLIEQLPKPLQIALWVVLGLALVALLVWLLSK
jgi:predicted membrane channel-forming protein YqfA (hemolysin III family)